MAKVHIASYTEWFGPTSHHYQFIAGQDCTEDIGTHGWELSNLAPRVGGPAVAVNGRSWLIDSEVLSTTYSNHVLFPNFETRAVLQRKIR